MHRAGLFRSSLAARVGDRRPAMRLSSAAIAQGGKTHDEPAEAHAEREQGDSDDVCTEAVHGGECYQGNRVLYLLKGLQTRPQVHPPGSPGLCSSAGADP